LVDIISLDLSTVLRDKGAGAGDTRMFSANVSIKEVIKVR